ncbi:MAG: Hsp20/alpha crystallin family protein [Deltaproteobacteria bacterium]|nr:Hsp20/alpha crystallin family protein [Deltaproteobacteria bacterium]
MALKVWEPFEELSTLQDRINRLFEGLMPEFGRGKASAVSKWSPAVDIYEDKSNIYLDVEIPGMKKEDVKVKVEDKTLTVSGERKLEREEKKEGYYRMERSYGSFCRSFYLPDNVDPAKIKAKYESGVLKLSIPKKEEAKPKEIPVNVE